MLEHVLRLKSARARVVVTGCLTKIHREGLGRFAGIDIVQPDSMERLDELIQASVPFGATRTDRVVWKSVPPSAGFLMRFLHSGRPALQRQIMRFLKFLPPGMIKTIRPDLLPRIRRAGLPDARRVLVSDADIGPGVFHLEVSQGCLGVCAYCVFKFVWGKIMSRPLDEILAEFAAARRQGYKLFSLDAQDLGAYGQDIGQNVVDLLRALFHQSGDYRIILHDFNPQWFIRYFSELEELFVGYRAKIVYLDLPLQSGSSRILAAMRRPYTAEQVLPLIRRLKRVLPDLAIEIDIMVGFPGENEADFQETKNFLAALREEKSIFLWLTDYTDRPRTESSRMPDKISPDVKDGRMQQLKALADQYDFYQGDGVSVIHRGMQQALLSDQGIL